MSLLLSFLSSSDSSSENGERLYCDTCCFSHHVISYIKQHVNPKHHDLLDDALTKLELFFGHWVQVYNQCLKIDYIMSILILIDSILVMDFKIKYESIYHREKTTDFYGKKGSTMHGFMLYSRYSYKEKDKIEHLLDYRITYFDHISTGDTKQDYVSIMSYFEATCTQIAVKFPYICNLHVQSDNARCYKKGNLLFGMYKIAQNYGINLRSYIHTRVQDGKGSIDAHFATAMRHIHCYCDMGADVVTPIKIVDALNANGGVNNTIAEIVGINRPAVQKFEKENHAAIREFCNIGEHMEVTFNAETNVAVVYENSNLPSTRTYSIVGNINKYESDMESNYNNSDKDEIEEEFVEDIGIEEKGRGNITKCIIYGSDLVFTDKP